MKLLQCKKRRIFIKLLKNIEIIFRSRVQLTLLHVNDVHSHFEEVNINTSTCKYEVDYLFQKIQWIRFKTQSQTLITEKYVSVLSIIVEESIMHCIVFDYKNMKKYLFLNWVLNPSADRG